MERKAEWRYDGYSNRMNTAEQDRATVLKPEVYSNCTEAEWELSESSAKSQKHLKRQDVIRNYDTHDKSKPDDADACCISVRISDLLSLWEEDRHTGLDWEDWREHTYTGYRQSSGRLVFYKFDENPDESPSSTTISTKAEVTNPARRRIEETLELYRTKEDDFLVLFRVCGSFP